MSRRSLSTGELVEMVTELTDIHDNRVSPHLDLFDDLALDSVDLTELLLAIEQRLGMQIPYGEMSPQDVRTIAGICNFLDAHVHMQDK